MDEMVRVNLAVERLKSHLLMVDEVRDTLNDLHGFGLGESLGCVNYLVAPFTITLPEVNKLGATARQGTHWQIFYQCFEIVGPHFVNVVPTKNLANRALQFYVRDRRCDICIYWNIRHGEIESASAF
ncbi:hypothetical protein SBA4_1810005 [Candidatus Sulfopaludibacter sp. SbA4]|nr:hypothetical protein SBA4_1810005 [Candidatus Sulfopaludibacter sp. SbA4]